MADVDLALSISAQPTARPFQQTILYIEDNPDNANVLRRALQFKAPDRKYTVLHAKDGARGLALAEQRPEIDIIFLDIHLPDMDGFEVIRKIRANAKRQFIIIALTGDTRKETQAKIEATDFDGYLSKPLEFQVLWQMLSDYLSVK